MFELDITKWVPKFILADKNGYALAKAIEAGLQAANDIVSQGVDCITDVDAMPEWRLDEVAWEYNILYDYDADIATKRKWVSDAVQTYAIYGTPEIIIKYLSAAFDTAYLEEWWQYGGDPFHFRVTVAGEWTDENDAWAQKSIAKTKNVRSILDNIIFNAGESTAEMSIACAVTGMEIQVTSKMV